MKEAFPQDVRSVKEVNFLKTENPRNFSKFLKIKC